jgi:hypothetical protein
MNMSKTTTMFFGMLALGGSGIALIEGGGPGVVIGLAAIVAAIVMNANLDGVAADEWRKKIEDAKKR